MAAPVLASYAITRSSGDVTSLTVSNKPSGVVAGDLLILIGSSDLSGGVVWSTDPTGFTMRVEDNETDNGFSIYTRIASGDSGDDNPILDLNSGSQDIMAFYIRVTGAHATTYWDVLGTKDSGWQSLNSPSVTTTVDDCLAFALHFVNHSDAYPQTCSGTGWGTTPDIDGRNPDSSGTNGSSAAVVTRTVATAGASNAVTWSTTSNDWDAGIQFAIAPAEAGPSPLVLYTSPGLSVTNP
jgi:hypothetical protein